MVEAFPINSDNGTAFYKELKQRLDEYFTNTQTSREGNGIMRFKIFLYFGLDILFYVLMINSRGSRAGWWAGAERATRTRQALRRPCTAS